jgi:REP element-mobilizing transposase RayT
MPLRELPERRNLRVPGWDYRSPGAYAITMVTQYRAWMFGEGVGGRVVHNAAGDMAAAVWMEMAGEFDRVTLDAFVVMPNHLHAIVHLGVEGPAGNPRLGDVVQRFKTITTIRYATGVHNHGWEPFEGRLWQTEYYDHIIRDEADLDRCRRYIIANPANWETDRDRTPLPRPATSPVDDKRV